MKPSMNERTLIERIGRLPKEITPRRDPWPEIAARIEPRTGRESRSARANDWMLKAVAASVLLVLLGGLLLGPPWSTSTRAPAGSATAERGGQPAEALRLKGVLAASEAEYRAAFREFIPVGESRASLPVKTVEMIESGWADLAATEGDLAEALREDPQNLFLNARMLELRARQLGFLKQLARLDRNSRRMTT